MGLTPIQVIALVMSTLGVLGAAGTQLDVLFGAALSKSIVTICGLASTIFGGWIAVLSGQSAIVKQVAAMPGVESIRVNAQANQTLAQIAVDPNADKVEPIPGATQRITATAKGESNENV